MIKKTIHTLLLALFVSNGYSSVTVQINSSGWGDSDTTAVAGMAWGIVVASDGSSFGGTAEFGGVLESILNGFAMEDFATPSVPTQIGATSYYFLRAQSNTTTTGPLQGHMASVQFDLDSEITTGDAFGLLWFPSGDGVVSIGDSFGFQDLNETIPPDGFTTDPIGGSPGLATFNVVPEPSTYAAIAGLMVLGFAVARRRR